MEKNAFRYPDFFHIGAYKSASTSLHYYLSQHPQICMAREKGGNYLAFAGKNPADDREFGQNIIRESDYRALFADYNGEPVIGESSPHYLVSTRACERIRQVRPDARLVVILRNPVEAIYSRYLMRCRSGTIDIPFRDVMDREEAILATGKGKSRLQLGTAFYARWLGEYFQRFPPEQISVQLYEDYLHHRDAQLSDLFTFLGVDSGFVPQNLRHYNRSGIPRQPWLRGLMRQRSRLQPLARRVLPSRARAYVMDRLSDRLERPGLPDHERRRLVSIYREDILLLETLLRRDLQHWLEAPS